MDRFLHNCVGMHWFLRSNFNTRELSTVLFFCFFGHNSLPRRSYKTILRHKLPIITPELPIPTRNLNSSVRPKFLNPIFYIKPETITSINGRAYGQKPWGELVYRLRSNFNTREFNSRENYGLLVITRNPPVRF